MRRIAAPQIAVFDKVGKFNNEVMPPGIIFGSLSFVLPTNRKLAIVGRKETGRTTLLKLLRKEIRPDTGRVISKARFSMILNDQTFLHPRMTVIENIESLARMYSIDKNRLWQIAVTVPSVKSSVWQEEVGDLEAKDRRSVETILAAILPYDCYLADDIEQLDQNVLSLAMKIATARSAGFIFTTYSLKLARQHSDSVGVITNQQLYLFDSASEAEKFYER